MGEQKNLFLAIGISIDEINIEKVKSSAKIACIDSHSLLILFV